MLNLGDIRGIDGAGCPAVDVITGGSPCQDLSVAGSRTGLFGERSGLFIEQLRIVAEMRAATHGLLPRYMVWENVPGALNSNNGKDFMEVLNGCVRIPKANAIPVPMPKDGKWPKAGCLYDDMGGWSIAWRVHDAQYWGVAQRRRRIALVCDFGGMSAPEVLFERQSVPGNFDARGTQGEGAVDTSVGSITEPDRIWDARGNGDGRLSATIAGDHDSSISDYTNAVVQSEALKVTTKESVLPSICIGNGQAHVTDTEEVSQTLNCMHDPMTILEPFIIDRAAFNQGKNARFDIKIEETQTAPSLVARGPHAVAQPVQYRVRRLTPLECTRLQGFPDGWVDIGDWTDSKGKKHKEADAPKYKALGNSIALPFWRWLLRRIYDEVKRCYTSPTLGSLFDGIGGFPLCWPGETVWSSEIDEFCCAVTRRRFEQG